MLWPLARLTSHSVHHPHVDVMSAPLDCVCRPNGEHSHLWRDHNNNSHHNCVYDWDGGASRNWLSRTYELVLSLNHTLHIPHTVFDHFCRIVIFFVYLGTKNGSPKFQNLHHMSQSCRSAQKPFGRYAVCWFDHNLILSCFSNPTIPLRLYRSHCDHLFSDLYPLSWRHLRQTRDWHIGLLHCLL